MSERKVPAEVYDFMATLKDMPPSEPPAVKRLHEPEKLRRCGDCRKERDLIRYGLLDICRGCAATRDRAHGLTVADAEWR